MSDQPRDIFKSDDAVYRHIGRIVRIGSDLENTATFLVSWLVNPDDSSKAEPLVKGRRFNELIDFLAKMLPPYEDREAFVTALRLANNYRDLLAHTTRDFTKDDLSDSDVQWLARQQRKGTTRIRLHLGEAPEKEADALLLLSALTALTVALLMAREDTRANTIREELIRHSAGGKAYPQWGDAAVQERLDRLMGA